jgi:drug/metabolite transporter (DMT)-like permease
MIDYIFISIAVMAIAVQFSLTKVYQKRFVRGVDTLLFFPIVTASAGAVFFLIINLIQNGYALQWGVFTFFMSLALAIVATCSHIIGILVMRLGKISVYTIFMMLGGMMLPFFYGLLFLGEAPTPARFAGIAILTASLFMPFVKLRRITYPNAGNPQSPAEPQKSKAAQIMFMVLCSAIFVLNGCVSILNKAHQINPQALDTNNYVIWQNLFMLVLSMLILAVYRIVLSKKRSEAPPPADAIAVKMDKRMFLAGIGIIVVYALISGTGGLLMLLSAETLPASVLYPMVTGGTIVLTSFAGRLFFKEKLNVQLLISLALTVIGTLLFLF